MNPSELFAQHLNGERLVWAGSPQVSLSLKALLMMILCAVLIVGFTYGIAFVFKMVRTWPEFLTKFQPVIIGSLAGMGFFVMPPANVYYALTETRALILNRSAEKHDLASVNLADARIRLSRDLLGKWQVVIDAGTRLEFRNAALNTEAVALLKRGTAQD